MLMLMRSEGAEGSSSTSDCDDPLVVIACAAESDACPAACREDAKEDKTSDDEVVKSGDLNVSVKANEGRKVAYFLNTTTASDLDTISFKASEAGITLNSVTLERYGYANDGDITRVWLEDENGNEIAKPKTVGKKGTVTLSIKSDYKELDKSETVTIVVETNGLNSVSYDGTVGFKVTAVDASAENVEIEKYTPYEYSFVSYGWTTIYLTWKGKADSYNYEEGASYEVAKFKLEAWNSALSVNGFTLTNAGSIDLDDNLADVEVLIAWEAVKGLEWSVDKKELKINFNDVEIAAKANVMVTVNVTLVDTFEDFNENIDISIVKPSHINAVEKKTGSRVSLVGDVDTTSIPLATRTAKLFNWGQIRLSGEKLWTVNAAAGSSDVVLAEGTIKLSGASLEFPALKVYAKTTNNVAATQANGSTIPANTTSDVKIFDELRLVINWETFDWNYNAFGVYVIDSFTLEKWGKFQIVADLLDVDDMEIKKDSFNTLENTSLWKFDDATITLTIDGDSGTPSSSFSSSIFKETTAPYLDSVKYVDPDGKVASDDMIGTINLAKLKLSAAKGSLDSKTSLKDVEYLTNESTTKTIYEGTYTAKNETVYLNSFSVASDDVNTTDVNALNNANMRFYLSIDGEEVASAKADTATAGNPQTAADDFANVKVEAWKSVSVKLELEANPKVELSTEYSYTFVLSGENENTDPAGRVEDTTVKVDFVTAGSVNIVNYAVQDRVEKAWKNITIAEFIVKPSDGAEGVYLSDFALDVSDVETAPSAANYKVVVDWSEADQVSVATTTKYLVVDGLNVSLPSEWVKVVVTYRSNLSASNTKKTIKLKGVNKTTYNTAITTDVKTFNILAADGIVKIDSQENLKDETRFFFDVDTNNDYTVSSLKLYYGTAMTPVTIGNISDGDYEDVANLSELQYITKITYMVNSVDYTITKDDFKDFFKVWDSYAKIFKASND